MAIEGITRVIGGGFGGKGSGTGRDRVPAKKKVGHVGGHKTHRTQALPKKESDKFPEILRKILEKSPGLK